MRSEPKATQASPAIFGPSCSCRMRESPNRNLFESGRAQSLPVYLFCKRLSIRDDFPGCHVTEVRDARGHSCGSTPAPNSQGKPRFSVVSSHAILEWNLALQDGVPEGLNILSPE